MVYPIENCYNCNTELAIEDIVEGECKKCGFELCDTPIDEVESVSSFISNNGLTKSPYLTLVFSIEEQLKLVQRLTYCLINRTKLVDVELSSTEKAHLLHDYLFDVKLLHQHMNLSYSLLEVWPSKLVLFLIDFYQVEDKEKIDRYRIENKEIIDHFRDEYRNSRVENRVKEFMLDFVFHCSSEKIKDLLKISYERENGFRFSTTQFSKSHLQLDSEYVCVDDVTKMYHINYGTLYQLTKHNHIKTYVHPRNRLSVLE